MENSVRKNSRQRFRTLSVQSVFALSTIPGSRRLALGLRASGDDLSTALIYRFCSPHYIEQIEMLLGNYGP